MLILVLASNLGGSFATLEEADGIDLRPVLVLMDDPVTGVFGVPDDSLEASLTGFFSRLRSPEICLELLLLPLGIGFFTTAGAAERLSFTASTLLELF